MKKLNSNYLECVKYDSEVIKSCYELINSPQMNYYLNKGIKFKLERSSQIFLSNTILDEIPSVLKTRYKGHEYRSEITLSFDGNKYEFEITDLKRKNNSNQFKNLSEFIQGDNETEDFKSVTCWYEVLSKLESIKKSNPMFLLLWGLNTSLEYNKKVK